MLNSKPLLPHTPRHWAAMCTLEPAVSLGWSTKTIGIRSPPTRRVQGVLLRKLGLRMDRRQFHVTVPETAELCFVHIKEVEERLTCSPQELQSVVR